MLNVVQATINQSRTLLGYVTKSDVPVKDQERTDCREDTLEVYRVYLIELSTENKNIRDLELERSKQARIQFLYKQRLQRDTDKFLVLIHQECKND